jgi:hypothetical protein
LECNHRVKTACSNLKSALQHCFLIKDERCNEISKHAAVRLAMNFALLHFNNKANGDFWWILDVQSLLLPVMQ